MPTGSRSAIHEYRDARSIYCAEQTKRAGTEDVPFPGGLETWLLIALVSRLKAEG